MFIHERIMALLLEKGLTQKNLSDATGIAASAISDWKKRNTNPSADAIIRISEYLNVSTDYLLSGKEINVIKSEFDDDTQELITIYQNLDSRGKTVVKAAAYTQQDRMRNDRNKVCAQEKGKLSNSQNDELRDSGIA